MLKIGHRGASAHAPENTLIAFKKALELGADGIELDIHRCASGELVVIHDDTLERTTDGKGRVGHTTWAELSKLRIGDSEPIPTLEEVFKTLPSRTCYFVEIKHADAAVEAAKLMQVCKVQGYLISFKHAALAEARKSFPALAIGASFEKLTEQSVTQAKVLGASVLLPHYKELTEAYVQAAKKEGLLTVPWTVNEVGDIARLRKMGVDGIISDYPDRLTT